ncbi:hypothetical protein [Acetobacter sp. DsW_54]|uniref:hypothetical protein n=1 Tax=Acetobacter sp. DsW_54 TaxID=1670660 RepID=UPI000A396720|nr:hypothetical protein [Acetobacter sp. DsW_54]OUI98323.1 hypothetical protein HK20_07360 [Acetobacter sp. DsW_54]
MVTPSLLKLATEAAYREHFEKKYCRGGICTHDGIRVYFKKEDFDHAFFESPLRNGVKSTTLSHIRAERMDWIAATLANPAADLFQGWNKKEGCYDASRCVCIVFGNFVVVIRLSKNTQGTLKANFVTCYEADNSITKIRQSPLWNKNDCLNAL